MNLSRRGLFGMFAAGAGAAIIKTPGILMPIKPHIIEAEYIMPLRWVESWESDFGMLELVPNRGPFQDWAAADDRAIIATHKWIYDALIPFPTKSLKHA